MTHNAENDAETYCGAEYGEVREGECECPRCVGHPDPLQDWPMPGYLKSDDAPNLDHSAENDAPVRVGFRYQDGEVLSPEREAVSHDEELPEVVLDLGDGEWLTLPELRVLSPADPICNERGIPESECPAHCRHTRAIPPVDPDDLCLTCGATNGVCRCPIPPGEGK